MDDSRLTEFRERLGEIHDVNAALALLSWDQETYMPPKAAPARGQQRATLSAIAHRLLTSEEMGGLLEELEGDSDGLGEDDTRLVAEVRYDYDRARRLPESFVRRFAQETSAAYEVWVKARREAQFDLFRPRLETVVELLRERADLLGYEGSPYNALLEDYERGMRVEELRPLFAELGARQSALVERIKASGRDPETAWMDQTWDEDAQWAFTLHVLGDMGFDLEAGRQDKSVHPFTTSFDVDDVRLTTRVDARDPFSALTGSIHEGGHGLYEQGFDREYRRTPLADAPSLGIHESQSRLWENLIGRSLAFWKHYTPEFRARFPGQLDGVSAEAIHACINRVRPSLIRVEADECTYNLHIIMRFEIEVDVIEGALAVKDIPEAWTAKMKQYLGIEVPDDAQGCLQDIHWSHGGMGYFPTYTLGNLYAAQLFDKILEDIPTLWDDVEAGRFAGLLEWLRRHVHVHGRRKLAREIVRDATGREPGTEAYLAYLESKYGALYGLDEASGMA